MFKFNNKKKNFDERLFLMGKRLIIVVSVQLTLKRAHRFHKRAFIVFAA